MGHYFLDIQYNANTRENVQTAVRKTRKDRRQRHGQKTTTQTEDNDTWIVHNDTDRRQWHGQKLMTRTEDNDTDRRQ